MLAIDPSELAQMQADLQSAMPNTCNITRPTGQASDNAGGFTESYTAVASGVACSVYPARGLSSLALDVQENMAGRVIGDWIINLPWGTSVLKRDRILVIESSRTYEVIDNEAGASYSATVPVKVTLIE